VQVPDVTQNRSRVRDSRGFGARDRAPAENVHAGQDRRLLVGVRSCGEALPDRQRACEPAWGMLRRTIACPCAGISPKTRPCTLVSCEAAGDADSRNAAPKAKTAIEPTQAFKRKVRAGAFSGDILSFLAIPDSARHLSPLRHGGAWCRPSARFPFTNPKAINGRARIYYVRLFA
jgi:hypothetical protein